MPWALFDTGAVGVWLTIDTANTNWDVFDTGVIVAGAFEPTAFYDQAFYVSKGIWTKISTTQTAGWQAVDTSQTAGWTKIETS